MKKIALVLGLLGLVAVPMSASAQVLGTTAVEICSDGKLGADGTNKLVDPADETTLLFIKKAWTPTCSSNVFMAGAELNGWVVASAASKKGKYWMGGNTEGLAPMCVKKAKGDIKCDETATVLVDPTALNTAQQARAKLLVGTAKGLDMASEPFSPCAWAEDPAKKAGCQ